MRIASLKPIIAILLILTLVSATSFAVGNDSAIEKPTTIGQQEEETSGGLMMLDVLLVRPVSFVGLALGSVTWLIAAPFALMADGTKGIEKISKPLVVEPAKYTFKRSVGDF